MQQVCSKCKQEVKLLLTKNHKEYCMACAIPRYDFEHGSPNDVSLGFHPEGDWVKWDDIQELIRVYKMTSDGHIIDLIENLGQKNSPK